MVKNIIICLDGTGNSLTSDSSNVWNIYCTLPESKEQIKFYDAGCGTHSGLGVQTVIGNAGYRLLDTMFGYGVKRQACAGYKYLVDHYESGDRIYLFGFSRGAYSCRVLAAMIYALGLISPGRDHLIHIGWDIFDSDLEMEQKKKNLCKFKHSFARNHDRYDKTQTKVHFMGVWDTVSAYGSFRSFERHPYTEKTYTSITHIRHAMALDERRGMFRPFLFHPMDGKTNSTGKYYNGAASFRETWFRGCHSDVGGGQPEEQSKLSKVALEWMFRELDKLPRDDVAPLSVNQKSQGHFLGYRSSCLSKEKLDKLSATKQVRPDYNSDPTESLNTWYFSLMEVIPLRVHSGEEIGPRFVWSDGSICGFMYALTMGWILHLLFACVSDEMYGHYLALARSVLQGILLSDAHESQSISHEPTSRSEPSLISQAVKGLTEFCQKLPFWSLTPFVEDSKQCRGMVLTGPNWWRSREELLTSTNQEYERVVGVIDGLWLIQNSDSIQSEQSYRSKLAWRCDPATLSLAKRIHNYLITTKYQKRTEQLAAGASSGEDSPSIDDVIYNINRWTDFSKEAEEQALIDRYMLVIRGGGHEDADTIGDLAPLSDELLKVLAERLLGKLREDYRQQMREDMNILILYLEYKADGNPTKEWPQYLESLMTSAQRRESWRAGLDEFDARQTKATNKEAAKKMKRAATAGGDKAVTFSLTERGLKGGI